MDWSVVPTAAAVGTFSLAMLAFFFMRKGRIVVDLWFGVVLVCWFVLWGMAGGNPDSQYVMLAGVAAFFLFAKANAGTEWLTDRQAGVLFSSLLACEALWGIAQFAQTGDSLRVTGHFDNPIGFALAVALPIPFLLSLWRNFACGVLVVVLVALCLSASRAVILASCAVAILYNYRSARWAKRSLFVRCVCGLCLVAFLIIVYYLKADSANGRLLIWGTALDMIWQQPWGYGIGGVAREYMNYQAEFLSDVASPYWQNLAGNVNRVFNEYLALGIELGVWTMLAALAVLVYVVRAIIREHDEARKVTLLVLFLILFVSLFSYPLYYPFTWGGWVMPFAVCCHWQNGEKVTPPCLGCAVFLFYCLSLVFYGSKGSCDGSGNGTIAHKPHWPETGIW